MTLQQEETHPHTLRGDKPRAGTGEYICYESHDRPFVGPCIRLYTWGLLHRSYHSTLGTGASRGGGVMGSEVIPNITESTWGQLGGYCPEEISWDLTGGGDRDFWSFKATMWQGLRYCPHRYNEFQQWSVMFREGLKCPVLCPQGWATCQCLWQLHLKARNTGGSQKVENVPSTHTQQDVTGDCLIIVSDHTIIYNSCFTGVRKRSTLHSAPPICSLLSDPGSEAPQSSISNPLLTGSLTNPSC